MSKQKKEKSRKKDNFTAMISHFAQFQTNQQLSTNQLGSNLKSHDSEENVHNLKVKSKSPQSQPNSQFYKEIIQNLLNKLSFMQNKQKQTEIKFYQCLKSLKLQIQLKQKKNQFLKQQIFLLKQEVVQLKNLLPAEIQQKHSKIIRNNQIHGLSIHSFINNHYGFSEKENNPLGLNSSFRPISKERNHSHYSSKNQEYQQNNKHMKSLMSKNQNQSKYLNENFLKEDINQNKSRSISPFSRSHHQKPFKLDNFSNQNQPNNLDSSHDDYNNLIMIFNPKTKQLSKHSQTINAAQKSRLRKQQRQKSTNQTYITSDFHTITINKRQHQNYHDFQPPKQFNQYRQRQRQRQISSNNKSCNKSSLSRQKKSKSIAGLLKSKLFVINK